MRTPYELADDELERRIEDGFGAVTGCRLKIFCPRPASWDGMRPAGERRACRKRGHPGVRRTRAARGRPCGHIHEARGEDAIGRSKVVNPNPARAGNYALFEIGNEIVVSFDSAASECA